MTESVLLANHAAGIAVGKVGTSVVTVEELSASSHRSEGKIKTWEGIEAIVEALRVEGRFDCIYQRLLRYLACWNIPVCYGRPSSSEMF